MSHNQIYNIDYQQIHISFTMKPKIQIHNINKL